MSNFYNNNFNKEYNESDKNLFSLPSDNTYAEKYMKKINNKNNNFKISNSNPKENQDKISIRTQIIENNSSKDIKNYIHCIRHPQNIICFFCKTDKIFPCSLCIQQHLEHEYSEFYCSKEYFLQEINKIKKIYVDVENRYFQNKKNAENFFLNIKNHFDDQIHKINDYFDSLISILQDKKSNFISKMLIIYENYIKEFVKFKEIFDFSDQSYSNLNQKIIFIENELYKKGDYESFYNIKDNIINDINNFSLYNNDNFSNNNRFNFNTNSMPFFLFPKKQIINIEDDDNLYGNFENANPYLNNKNFNNNLNKNEKRANSINNTVISKNKFNSYTNLNNINNNKKQNDNNLLLDSIVLNNTLKKDDINNSSLKKNLSDLESLFEKNKNKNIFSSINSGVSNTNDSFIEKQLIETDSTLFLLNKNEVKNVFNQQESDISQVYFEKNETKTIDKNDENNENNASESPKFNNLNKTKYTSCNKENRNKQIIKTFLENEDLNKNDVFEKNFKKKRNIKKEPNTYLNSNNVTYIENKSINKTLDNDVKFNNINDMKKSKSKKKGIPPNNKIKNSSRTRKRSGSTVKNLNKKNTNNSIFELKNRQMRTKDKKEISKKKEVNNINRYYINSFGEDNKFEDNKVSIFSFNDNNINQPLLTKNNAFTNYIINDKNINIHAPTNRNIANFNINSSGNKKNNDIMNNPQMSKISSNFLSINENNFVCYNMNRSNSNRYKKKMK